MTKETIGLKVKYASKALRTYINNKIHTDAGVTLSGTEGMVMRFVHEHQEEVVSAKMLMERFRVSKATMSQTLTGLIRKGLIEYAEWEKDGRVKRVILTSEGEALEKRVDAVLQECDRKIEEHFTEEELNELARLLDRLNNAVSDDSTKE